MPFSPVREIDAVGGVMMDEQGYENYVWRMGRRCGCARELVRDSVAALDRLITSGALARPDRAARSKRHATLFDWRDNCSLTIEGGHVLIDDHVLTLRS